MYYELLFNNSGMYKKAGKDDTLQGNMVSALVPFGTVNKVRDRDEGVLGYIVRALAQGSAGTTGALLGASPMLGIDEASDMAGQVLKGNKQLPVSAEHLPVSAAGALAPEKEVFNAAKGGEEALKRLAARGKTKNSILTALAAALGLTGYVAGSTAGDRAADRIL